MTVWQRIQAMVARLFDPDTDGQLRIERRALPAAAIESAGSPIVARGEEAVIGRPIPGPASTTSVDQRGRRARIHRAFDIASPVRDRFGLSGRSVEIDRLTQAVIEQHRHAVIYGARGSGKTSLARVFGDLADEAGQVVIYESTSHELSFAELFRPYLPYLPGAEWDGTFRQTVERFATTDYTVRELAGLFAEVREPVVLVLDEFDRIHSDQVRNDVAALMKLASDMRAEVRIVVVGIGRNVDQLIAGHPSLRRHMTSVPIGPIADGDLEALVVDCAQRAGSEFEAEALDMVVHAALGSPYHARLFGMNAALAAARRDSATVATADVIAGFGTALADWAEISEDSYRLFERLTQEDAGRRILTRVAVRSARALAAVRPRAIGPADDDGIDEVERTAGVREALDPVLQPSASNDDFVFADSLAPQFLAVMSMYGARAA